MLKSVCNNVHKNGFAKCHCHCHSLSAVTMTCHWSQIQECGVECVMSLMSLTEDWHQDVFCVRDFLEGEVTFEKRQSQIPQDLWQFNVETNYPAEINMMSNNVEKCWALNKSLFCSFDLDSDWWVPAHWEVWTRVEVSQFSLTNVLSCSAIRSKGQWLLGEHFAFDGRRHDDPWGADRDHAWRGESVARCWQLLATVPCHSQWGLTLSITCVTCVCEIGFEKSNCEKIRSTSESMNYLSHEQIC